MVVVEEVVDEVLVELLLVRPVTSFAFPLVDVRIVYVKHTA